MIKTALILALILGIGLPSAQSAFACADADIQHWNKIIFTVNENLQNPTNPIISVSFPHELLVKVDPDVPQNLFQLVFDKLDSLDYVDSAGEPVQTGDIESIVEVEYSTICGDLLSQIVGGLLLEPNVGALLLAYAIMNAVWAVPTLAGLGIGIYLIKKRF